MDQENCRAIVVAADGWHPGVIGIVASRLVDRFNKPTVMIAVNEGKGQGSARSIPTFHVTKAFSACAELLESFGGHEMAAGLKLKAENVPAFREAFLKYANQTLTPEQLIPELYMEALAELRHLSLPLVQEVQKMAPFGSAIGDPHFMYARSSHRRRTTARREEWGSCATLSAARQFLHEGDRI